MKFRGLLMKEKLEWVPDETGLEVQRKLLVIGRKTVCWGVLWVRSEERRVGKECRL